MDEGSFESFLSLPSRIVRIMKVASGNTDVVKVVGSLLVCVCILDCYGKLGLFLVPFNFFNAGAGLNVLFSVEVVCVAHQVCLNVISRNKGRLRGLPRKICNF